MLTGRATPESPGACVSGRVVPVTCVIAVHASAAVLAAVPTQVEGPRGQAPQYSFGFAERMPEETTAKNHMGPGFDADYLGASSPGPASYKVSQSAGVGR